ncbi:Molybdenum cofactor synthesis protein 3 [Phlyctochytrium bullatum]|nr:Molybdenum cofactor synthesis protein 3 [Phlyctochytrium bullatum]
MLLLDAASGTFRSIKLRPKAKTCAVCGESPTVTELIDYVQFCGAAATDKSITQHILTPSERVSPAFLQSLRDSPSPHLLLDVRDRNQFAIASIPGSVNIPWKELPRRLGEVLDIVKPGEDRDGKDGAKDDTGEKQTMPVYVVCRLGNDSQLAVQLLKAGGIKESWDLAGGLYQWSDEVDPSFPKY